MSRISCNQFACLSTSKTFNCKDLRFSAFAAQVSSYKRSKTLAVRPKNYPSGRINIVFDFPLNSPRFQRESSAAPLASACCASRWAKSSFHPIVKDHTPTAIGGMAVVPHCIDARLPGFIARKIFRQPFCGKFPIWTDGQDLFDLEQIDGVADSIDRGQSLKIADSILIGGNPPAIWTMNHVLAALQESCANRVPAGL